MFQDENPSPYKGFLSSSEDSQDSGEDDESEEYEYNMENDEYMDERSKRLNDFEDDELSENPENDDSDNQRKRRLRGKTLKGGYEEEPIGKTRGRRKKNEKTYNEIVESLQNLALVHWEMNSSNIYSKCSEVSSQLDIPTPIGKKITPVCFWFDVCSNYFPRGLFLKAKPEDILTANLVQISEIPIDVWLRANVNKVTGYIIMKNIEVENQAISKSVKVSQLQVKATADGEELPSNASTQVANFDWELNYRNKNLYTIEDDKFLLESKIALIDMLKEKVSPVNSWSLKVNHPKTVEDFAHLAKGCSIDELLNLYEAKLEKTVTQTDELIAQTRNNMKADFEQNSLWSQEDVKNVDLQDPLADFLPLTKEENEYLDYLAAKGMTASLRIKNEFKRRREERLEMSSKGVYYDHIGLKVPRCPQPRSHHGELIPNVGKSLAKYKEDEEWDDNNAVCAVCNDGCATDEDQIIFCAVRDLFPIWFFYLTSFA